MLNSISKNNENIELENLVSCFPEGKIFSPRNKYEDISLTPSKYVAEIVPWGYPDM